MWAIWCLESLLFLAESRIAVIRCWIVGRLRTLEAGRLSRLARAGFDMSSLLDLDSCSTAVIVIRWSFKSLCDRRGLVDGRLSDLSRYGTDIVRLGCKQRCCLVLDGIRGVWLTVTASCFSDRL